MFYYNYRFRAVISNLKYQYESKYNDPEKGSQPGLHEKFEEARQKFRVLNENAIQCPSKILLNGMRVVYTVLWYASRKRLGTTDL
jgi:hypothetical protein